MKKPTFPLAESELATRAGDTGSKKDALATVKLSLWDKAGVSSEVYSVFGRIRYSANVIHSTTKLYLLNCTEYVPEILRYPKYPNLKSNDDIIQHFTKN